MHSLAGSSTSRHHRRIPSKLAIEPVTLKCEIRKAEYSPTLIDKHQLVRGRQPSHEWHFKKRIERRMPSTLNRRVFEWIRNRDILINKIILHRAEPKTVSIAQSSDGIIRIEQRLRPRRLRGTNNY